MRGSLQEMFQYVDSQKNMFKLILFSKLFFYMRKKLRDDITILFPLSVGAFRTVTGNLQTLSDEGN